MKRSYIKRKPSPHDWPTMCCEVHERCGGFCERCGTWIGDIEPPNCHHVLSRGKGGSDDVSNLVGLCYSYYGDPGCHQWVENNPKEAKEEGWTL